MAGRTIFILGNIKIFGIENTAEIGNVVETFNVPFKCTHNAWFVFQCFNVLMETDFVFLG